MTTPASHPKFASGPWHIHYPDNQNVPPGSLTVQVDDESAGNQYLVAVYNKSDPMPAYSLSLTPMVFNATTGYYEANFTVSAPPADKYVVVYVRDHPGNFNNVPFHVGVGSSGSFNDDALAAAKLAKVLPKGRPAPVSVSAQFGAAPKSSSGAQVEAAILVYSGAPGFERCWFSQPIDLRSDSVDPAIWMLERTDARTWLLRLRRGSFDLVVYRHKASGEKDGSLPAQLHVEGDGNGAGAEWPLTVTISPAP